MTLTVDISEAAVRLDELLAEVEAGHDVVLARGATPVARVIREVERPDHDIVEETIEAIRARRRHLPPTTLEEILQWRDEDRR